MDHSIFYPNLEAADHDSSMSHNDLEEVSKRRRIARACEQCRKKKIRCDGDIMCSNCNAYQTLCVYTEAPKKQRAPVRGAKYIASLEDRLQRMESLLGQSSAVNLTTLAGGSDPASSETLTPASSHIEGGMAAPQDVQNVDGELAEELGCLLLQGDGESEYLGPSNSATVLFSAHKQIQEVLGDESFSKFCDYSHEQLHAQSRRSDARLVNLIEQSPLKQPQSIRLPDKATCDSYIKAYFEQLHFAFPLLDEEEFLDQAARMHTAEAKSDVAFTCLYLLVLTFGSHLALDVSLGQEDGISYQFYMQAHKLVYSIAHITSFQTLKVFMLLALYLGSTGRQHTLWYLLGNTIRMAQTLGIHRKLRFRQGHGPECPDAATGRAESRRRAFWILYSMDKNSVEATGKPAGIQDFDCDQEIPLVTPSELARFGGMTFSNGAPYSFLQSEIQLAKISHRAQQQLYSIEALSLSSDQLAHRIAELDEELTAWLETLPDVFQPATTRSSSHRKVADESTVSQFSVIASLVHLRYFNLMMTIHRRNIQSVPSGPIGPSGTSERPPRTHASHSIAIQAARSCLDVLKSGPSRFQKTGMRIYFPNSAGAALVLFVNLIRNPGSITSRADLEKLVGLVDFLESCIKEEKRLLLVKDFFAEVVRISELAILRCNAQGTKRNRIAPMSIPQRDTAYDAVPNDMTSNPSGRLADRDPYMHVPETANMMWNTPIGAYVPPGTIPLPMEYMQNMLADYQDSYATLNPFYGTPADPIGYGSFHFGMDAPGFESTFDDILWRNGVAQRE